MNNLILDPLLSNLPKDTWRSWGQKILKAEVWAIYEELVPQDYVLSQTASSPRVLGTIIVELILPHFPKLRISDLINATMKADISTSLKDLLLDRIFEDIAEQSFDDSYRHVSIEALNRIQFREFGGTEIPKSKLTANHLYARLLKRNWPNFVEANFKQELKREGY
jgi:hypothetical protein